MTFNKLLEKFEDKGLSVSILLLNLPPTPIFDPSYIELRYNNKEDLYKTFLECNAWRFKHYQDRLEELSIWINHQKHYVI